MYTLHALMHSRVLAIATVTVIVFVMPMMRFAPRFQVRHNHVECGFTDERQVWRLLDCRDALAWRPSADGRRLTALRW